MASYYDTDIEDDIDCFDAIPDSRELSGEISEDPVSDYDLAQSEVTHEKSFASDENKDAVSTQEKDAKTSKSLGDNFTLSSGFVPEDEDKDSSGDEAASITKSNEDVPLVHSIYELSGISIRDYDLEILALLMVCQIPS